MGSYLMIFIGLTLSESADLSLARRRPVDADQYEVFVYGGLLALVSLLFGFPEISVPQIMALVAILHMVESFLIFSSGHLGAVPAYIKGQGGRITGGFTLQKFWPIPLVALVVMAGGGVVEGGIEMPGWWPLIKPGVPGDPQTLTYIPIRWWPPWAMWIWPCQESGGKSISALIWYLQPGAVDSGCLVEQSRSVRWRRRVPFWPRGCHFRRGLNSGKKLYVPPGQGVRFWMCFRKDLPGVPVYVPGMSFWP